MSTSDSSSTSRARTTEWVRLGRGFAEIVFRMTFEGIDAVRLRGDRLRRPPAARGPGQAGQRVRGEGMGRDA